MIMHRKSDLLRNQNKRYGKRFSDVNNRKILSLTVLLCVAAYFSNYHLASVQSTVATHHFNIIGFQTALNWMIGGGFLGLLTSVIRHNHLLFKRSLDLLASLTGLIVFSPLLLILSALIKWDSKGPVFFSQLRLGKNGKPFHIWKLRTMRQDAEEKCGPVWARQRDPRVTNIGQFLRSYHLDEIPQLINVLKGDMSLVGPRPERPQMAELIQREVPNFSDRLDVKPGITGLAQVRYQYGASIKDSRRKLKYDLIYRERKSWKLDLTIFFWTLEKILIGEKSR